MKSYNYLLFIFLICNLFNLNTSFFSSQNNNQVKKIVHRLHNNIDYTPKNIQIYGDIMDTKIKYILFLYP